MLSAGRKPPLGLGRGRGFVQHVERLDRPRVLSLRLPSLIRQPPAVRRRCRMPPAALARTYGGMRSLVLVPEPPAAGQTRLPRPSEGRRYLQLALPVHGLGLCPARIVY